MAEIHNKPAAAVFKDESRRVFIVLSAGLLRPRLRKWIKRFLVGFRLPDVAPHLQV